jgi:hypothetical protein
VHSVPASAFRLNLRTATVLTSNPTSSNHTKFGLSTPHLPPGSAFSIINGIWVSSILMRHPSNSSLLDLISVIKHNIHKRTAWFQKLIKNVFLTLHWHNIYCQQRDCPRFSCATSSWLLMLTAGPRDQFPKWRRSRK